MDAVVITKSCKASEMKISSVPMPVIRKGMVLVKVKAFGINRAEVIFRSYEADAPYITLPRIPGIECVGEIVDGGESSLKSGQRVVALMGGMGRSFDGSYAEYAVLPEKNVFPVNNHMSWETLAAIPETFFTAYGSLFQCLQLQPEETLFIRSASSALGLAAMQLAKGIGCTVVGTTRNAAKLDFLREAGVDYPLLDNETLPDELHRLYPQGVDKVLELVGPKTMDESIRFLKFHGILCQTGILGKQNVTDPMDLIKMIPNGVYLSSFYSNFPNQEIMDKIFSMIDEHQITPIISKVFPFKEISKAHQLMESNMANGKIVVVISD